MSNRTCDCGKPVWNQDVFCLACLRSTRHHLANQASYEDDLTTEQTRLAKKQPPHETRPPNDPTSYPKAGDKYLDEITSADLREWDRRARKAGELLHRQRNLLVSWCRWLDEEGIDTNLPPDRTPAMAAFLEANLKHLRNKDDGGRLVLEVRTLSQEILRLIDNPEKRTAHLGLCPNKWPLPEGEGEDWCPGEVSVILWADESRPLEARCAACGQVWDSAAFSSLEREISKRETEQRAARLRAEAMVKKGVA